MMKKSIFLTLFILMLANPAFAEPNFYLTYEGRQSIPHSDNDNYPISVDPFGIVEELKFNDVYSYRTGGGVFFGKGFDVGVFYSALRDKKQKTDIPMNSNILSIYGLFDAPNSNYLVKIIGESRAEGTFGANIIDFEVGYTFKLKSTEFRAQAGLRYAKYTQTTLAIKTNQCTEFPGATPPITCELPLQFWYDVNSITGFRMEGAGPRIGLSIKQPLFFIDNLSVIASGNWAVLFQKGERKLLHEKFENIEYPLQSNRWLVFGQETADGKYETTNHSLDMEAGLSYEFKFSDWLQLEAEAGYQFNAHYGATSSSSFDVRLNKKFGFLEGDIIHHGPFLRTTVKF